MLKIDRIYGFEDLIRNQSVETMQRIAENILNPNRYHLSREAKKRLGWMYLILYECQENTARAARKIGISRTWLSILKNKWEFHRRDPRFLEPDSRSPQDVSNRKRISEGREKKIIEVRKKYGWGKDKLERVLARDYGIKIGATTINRYLWKNNLINIRLSIKNQLAWKNKKESKKMKCRPPGIIKDYKPGALIEKDMKFILKTNEFANSMKYRAKENFFYQHTVIDSFTRIRTIGLCRESDSQTAVAVQEKAIARLPFSIACANTDNGGENEGSFSDYLASNDIFHFYSRSGTPTDNPRVERSHLTDEAEFWNRIRRRTTFQEKEAALRKWENIYNYVRPHQALGMLTPMEFYELWKTNSDQAYAIKDKYQKYLRKNAKRLSLSRRMKNKEQIEKLMKQIDEKLNNSYQ
jgi:transposase InsO family protein